MKKKHIRQEYLILIIAWLFWSLAEILSWRFYNKELAIHKMISIKTTQSIIALGYNFITVWLISLAKAMIKTRLTRFLTFGIIIIAISAITVYSNTSFFRFAMGRKVELIPFTQLVTFSLQKIIYFTGFTTLFFMIRNFRELELQRKQILEAQNLATDSQLQVLQQQINPHFLFNALNSLRNLISSDAALARDMVTNISDFLRETLNKNGVTEIPLSDEIKILENYLDIQKIRFGKDLQIKYSIAPETNKFLIPTFVLQPMAENAIKHGMKSHQVLTIETIAEVKQDYLSLTVRNNGKLSIDNSLTGHGNRNIEKRLKLLYNENALFQLYESDGYVISEIKISINQLTKD